MAPHPFWQWTLAPPHKEKIFSLNFQNLCDNVVKKLVSEKRKCHQLQRDFTDEVPLKLMTFSYF